MSLPFEINNLEPETKEELLAAFAGEKSGCVYVGPKKFVMPVKYSNHASDIFNMDLRQDDIWVLSFPRSGTTLTQELVWLVKNNLDFDGALKQNLTGRYTFIEFNCLIPDDYKRKIIEYNNFDSNVVEMLNKMTVPGYVTCAKKKSPRFIKSHLPFSLLPTKLLDTCKVVYVARNPKDAAVSDYHFNRRLRNRDFQFDFTKYWDLMQRNLVSWAPYWSHIEEAWSQRNHANMLFLFYEDMIKDLSAVIHKVANFFGKEFTQEQVKKLAEHLNIENFRNNPSFKVKYEEIKGMINHEEQSIIRKGKSGSWRNYFSPEMNDKAEEWIKENENKIGINFQY